MSQIGGSLSHQRIPRTKEAFRPGFEAMFQGYTWHGMKWFATLRPRLTSSRPSLYTHVRQFILLFPASDLAFLAFPALIFRI